MRTAAFIQVLLASLVLSGCASTALEFPPRNVANENMWRIRPAYVIPSPVLPTVDTTLQREALRRAPHGVDRINGQR